MSKRRTVLYVVAIDTTAHDDRHVRKALETELRLAFGSSLRRVDAITPVNHKQVGE